jgi:TetR/AcrR family fatty acid metabolism transcriptional regulator
MTLDAAIDKKPVSDKRQKIIQAAISVFSEHGFYNSTVADVAREAQVADGTIYLYFKNKDDLLISIFEHSMDFFIQAARDEMKDVTDPRERLKTFIELHLKLVQKNQDLAQVIQIELRQSAKFMKEYANEKFFEYLGIVGAILEDGQKEGLFDATLDPVILKRAIFGAVDEMALEWILMKRKRYSMEEASTQLSRLFTHGLLKKS